MLPVLFHQFLRAAARPVLQFFEMEDAHDEISLFSISTGRRMCSGIGRRHCNFRAAVIQHDGVSRERFREQSFFGTTAEGDISV